ncbi:hypothetical protein AKG37_05885 [Bacillus australimaris]|uniref:Uncharacterized protein n=1 Tax=Bacillus australimaris TaxID=1326968 RepID=A0ABR5MUY9_9BACI|nr:hypothetical protein AKG37_05885 [Bacillus australimaris]
MLFNIDLFVKFLITNLEMSSLRVYELELFLYIEILIETITNKYARDSQKIHSTLSAVFSAKYHGTENNPVKVVGNFEVTVNKRLNYWEFEEFKTFISVVEDPLYKHYILLFILVEREKQSYLP